MTVTNTGNVGIGTATPTERLQVEGAIRFSGALMPNNAAGLAGQLLRSQGPGLPPTWVTPTSFSPTITTAAGTASLNASNAVLAYTLVPGLSATITVPAGANHDVLVQTDGGIQLNSATAGATGFTDLTFYINGAAVVSGRRVPVGGDGAGYSVAAYSFSYATTLGPGTYTIQVRAKKFSSAFTDCLVSSGPGGSTLVGNPPLQGRLNIIQFP